MTAEEERTRLIGDIARVLREGPVPDDARAAALTFIGWLARRMPGEPVSHCDINRCKGIEYEGPASGPVPRAAYLDGSTPYPASDAGPPVASLQRREPRSAR